MRTLLVLLALGQVVNGFVYRYSFDTSEDVTKNIQCLPRFYNVAMFRVFENITVNQVGIKNYNAATTVFPRKFRIKSRTIMSILADFIELIVSLDPKQGGKQQSDAFLTNFNNGQYCKLFDSL
jgi:hypothetical protein